MFLIEYLYIVQGNFASIIQGLYQNFPFKPQKCYLEINLFYLTSFQKETDWTDVQLFKQSIYNFIFLELLHAKSSV